MFWRRKRRTLRDTAGGGSLADAAVVLLLNGVTISAEWWCSLDDEERLAIHQAREALEMELAQAQQIEAAMAANRDAFYAESDRG